MRRNLEFVFMTDRRVEEPAPQPATGRISVQQLARRRREESGESVTDCKIGAGQGLIPVFRSLSRALWAAPGGASDIICSHEQ